MNYWQSSTISASISKILFRLVVVTAFVILLVFTRIFLSPLYAQTDTSPCIEDASRPGVKLECHTYQGISDIQVATISYLNLPISIEPVLARGYDKNFNYGECKDVNVPANSPSGPGCQIQDRVVPKEIQSYPAEFVGDMAARRAGAILAITGDLAASPGTGDLREHGPEGLTIINGMRLDGCQNIGDCDNNETRRPSLTFSANHTEISIKTAQQINDIESYLRHTNDQSYHAIGGCPLLVQDGVNLAEISGKIDTSMCPTVRREADNDLAGRTAVGVTDNQDLIFVTVPNFPSDKRRMTLETLAGLMKELGAIDAMNLDGGGSTQLWYSGRNLIRSSAGRRISEALVVYIEAVELFPYPNYSIGSIEGSISSWKVTGEGLINIPDLNGQRPSSIKIPNGIYVKVYEQRNGQGASKIFTKSDADLRDDFFDNTSLVIEDNIASVEILYGIDVALVIDSSGSMGGNDNSGYRKLGAVGFVEAMLDQDQVAIVDFDDGVRTPWPLALNANMGKERATQAIGTIDNNGGTAIWKGLEEGFNQLNSSNASRPKAAILLTDGRDEPATYTRAQYEALATRFAENGWKVFTLGLGSNDNAIDEDLLRMIANVTGGEYKRLLSPNELPSIYLKINTNVAGGTQLSEVTTLLRQSEVKQVTVNLPVDQTTVNFLTTWEGSTVDTTLITPSGQRITPELAAQDPNISHVKAAIFELYTVLDPQEGNWQVELFGADLPAVGEDVTLRAAVRGTGGSFNSYISAVKELTCDDLTWTAETWIINNTDNVFDNGTVSISLPPNIGFLAGQATQTVVQIQPGNQQKVEWQLFADQLAVPQTVIYTTTTTFAFGAATPFVAAAAIVIPQCIYRSYMPLIHKNPVLSQMPIGSPTATKEPLSTSIPTDTPRPVTGATFTPASTPIPTATFTPTYTPTPTHTASSTSTPVPTQMPIPTPTFTPTNTNTTVPTSVPTPTFTPTDTPTYTPTPTNTFTPSPTDTLTPPPQYANISGRVGYDQDRDGTLQAAEAGLQDVVIYLLNEEGTLISATSTETGVGDWHFNNLVVEPNTIFQLVVDETTVPTGYQLTTTNVPTTVIISPGNIQDGYNFGYAPLPLIQSLALHINFQARDNNAGRPQNVPIKIMVKTADGHQVVMQTDWLEPTPGTDNWGLVELDVASAGLIAGQTYQVLVTGAMHLTKRVTMVLTDGVVVDYENLSLNADGLLWACDINQDNQVTMADYDLWVLHVQNGDIPPLQPDPYSEVYRSDQNGDGIIDIQDFSICSNNQGKVGDN